MSNDEVRRRVLGSDSRPLSEVISLHRLRWLGHVLRMPTHRFPQRALLALPGCGWKKQRGGQPMTWRRGVKKETSVLARVGSSRLPGWGPKDNESRWLMTLEDVAQSRNLVVVVVFVVAKIVPYNFPPFPLSKKEKKTQK